MLVELALLSLAAPAASAQELAPIGSSPETRAEDPLHRSAQVTVGASGTTVEWTADFTGTLHVWARSAEIEPTLRVTVDGSEPVHDDGGGGSTAAYLDLDVEPGALVELTVAAREGDGAAELHWIASPETHAMLVAAKEAYELVEEAARAFERGEGERARALGEESLAALRREDAALSPTMSGIASYAGIAMERFGAPQTTIDAHRIALAHLERTHPPEHRGPLRTRANLAIALNERRELAEARAIGEDVLAILERTRPEGDPALVVARQNLAITLHLQGEDARARPLLESVLEHYERTLPEDDPLLVRARRNLGALLGHMGHVEAAAELLESALASLERTRPEEDDELLSARENLAATVHLDQPARARELLEGVLAVRERLLPEDDTRVLSTRTNLANALKELGDLDAALALEEHVVLVRRRTRPQDDLDRLGAELNLASTQLSRGDLAGARALLERVVAAYESTVADDHADLQRARQNLGLVLSRHGDFDRARVVQEAVLEACERTLPPASPDLIAARANLASTLTRLGDDDGACALAEASLAACRTALPEDHSRLLRAREHLASALCGRGDFSGAREVFEAVLAERERRGGRERESVLITRRLLARVLHEEGDLGRAREVEERALAGFERTHPAHHREVVASRCALATIVAEQGDAETAAEIATQAAEGLLLALEHAARSLSRREARAAVESWAPTHASLRSLLTPDTAALRFALAETLRGVASLDVGGTAGRDDGDERLRSRIAGVRARIADLAASVPDTDVRLASRLDALTRERDALERTLRASLDTSGASTSPIRADDVARALPQDAVSIGFVRTRAEHRSEDVASLAAHVLAPSGVIVEVELGPASQIEELAAAWRSTFGEPLERGIGRTSAGEDDPERSAGAVLRARLLDPLLAALDPRTTTLLVCADDFVHALPLDALPLGEGRVGDRWRIVLQTSLRRLVAPLPAMTGAQEHELLVVGGVAFDAPGAAPSRPSGALPAAVRGGEGARARFGPLLQTSFEAEAVEALYERAERGTATRLEGASATKAAFLERAAGKRFVHVATHGWFDAIRMPQTAELQLARSAFGANERIRAFAPLSACGLALAGANRGRDELGRVPGILTAEELAGADLSACELAVLSACETNVDARSVALGLESLQAALHAAGARSAITSLWKVDDAATRRLFELFYTALWVEGLSKADALWKAKRALREEGHPARHWAAWVLSGEP